MRHCLLFAFAFVVVGCGETVENCPNFPRSDCCQTNAECFDFYGAQFSYCHLPDREHGGSCSECLRDKDCDDGETCWFDGNKAGHCG